VSEVANKLPGSQLLEIARKYESGNGVKADKSRAMTYYLYASAKGNGYARYKTGMAYRTGNGLPKDVAQGTRLVHEASDLGDGDASTELTILYSSENSGVTKDLRTAARYARTAYRQKSDPYTRYNMGIVTSNGWDEPADPVKATKYFTEAQQLGHAKAAERIAELAPKVAALQAAAATSQPADPSFIDSLKDVPNAGALFALGDEADEKGLKANARAAFRALVSRFPDSPLATKAADRLVPR
jgi:TPR repeat protein